APTCIFAITSHLLTYQRTSHLPVPVHQNCRRPAVCAQILILPDPPYDLMRHPPFVPAVLPMFSLSQFPSESPHQQTLTSKNQRDSDKKDRMFLFVSPEQIPSVFSDTQHIRPPILAANPPKE